MLVYTNGIWFGILMRFQLHLFLLLVLYMQVQVKSWVQWQVATWITYFFFYASSLCFGCCGIVVVFILSGGIAFLRHFTWGIWFISSLHGQKSMQNLKMLGLVLTPEWDVCLSKSASHATQECKGVSFQLANSQEITSPTKAGNPDLHCLDHDLLSRYIWWTYLHWSIVL